jgi:hypothetical protein
MLHGSKVTPVLVVLGLGSAVVACGDDEGAYVPKPAPSIKASLPPVPAIPQRPIKEGDAYTVWGASYHLRSRVYNPSIAGKDITLTGYITKTNIPEAPECAVHETGKADPPDCNAPIPSFWLGDSKDAPIEDCIKVMGWASNFAQLYDAVKEYEKREKHPPRDGEEVEPIMDEFWGVKIPDPLPGQGAKVSIKGNYSTTFTKATSGTEADPIMGIMTSDEITYVEKPPEPVVLPGMKK